MNLTLPILSSQQNYGVTSPSNLLINPNDVSLGFSAELSKKIGNKCGHVPGQMLFVCLANHREKAPSKLIRKAESKILGLLQEPKLRKKIPFLRHQDGIQNDGEGRLIRSERSEVLLNVFLALIYKTNLDNESLGYKEEMTMDKLYHFMEKKFKSAGKHMFSKMRYRRAMAAMEKKGYVTVDRSKTRKWKDGTFWSESAKINITRRFINEIMGITNDDIKKHQRRVHAKNPNASIISSSTDVSQPSYQSSPYGKKGNASDWWAEYLKKQESKKLSADEIKDLTEEIRAVTKNRFGADRK